MSDTETSSRRAEANRRNAQKSTGPRTAEGKARSRFNAIKHGMRAETPVLPGEDQAAFDDRFQRWSKDLAPSDEVEQFLVKRAVELSWQLERADRAVALSRKPAEDRMTAICDEVLAMGRRLFWDRFGPVSLYPQKVEMDGMVRSRSWAGQIDDPDDPARLVNRLESTAAGCGWMLDRWAELREILEAGLIWQASDRFKAIRLLGKQPLDAATDWKTLRLYCASGAMSPDDRVDFRDLADEMFVEQKTIFLERVNARLTPGLRPEDPEEGKAALLEIIADEEERLEGLLTEHLERTEPIVDTGFDDSDAGERLRRYQEACDRNLLRVLEALRKRRRDTDRAKAASAKAAKATKRDEQDQWRLIGRMLDVIGGSGGTAVKRAADPMASVGILDRNVGRPAATNEPRPTPPSAPAATNEPNAPPSAPAATNEPNAPARAAGPAMSAVVAVVLALIVGLSGAVLGRSNPPTSAGRAEPGPKVARRGDALPSGGVSLAPKGPQQTSPGHRPGGEQRPRVATERRQIPISEP